MLLYGAPQYDVVPIFHIPMEGIVLPFRVLVVYNREYLADSVNVAEYLEAVPDGSDSTYLTAPYRWIVS